MKDRLEALGVRIERLSVDPDRIDGQTLFRMVRPVVALAGWRAKLGHAALERLVKTLRDTPEGLEIALAAATKELEDTVTTLERVAIVRKRPPVAHAAWVRRAWELLVAASKVESGETAARVARTDRSAIMPPLALSTTPTAFGPFETPVPTKTETVPETEADARLVELELASIDHLLDAARAERSILGRKRRLLIAARQRLLEATAALPVDPQGARARADYVTKEIARINRLEHAGVKADQGLVHQARLAVDRGDPRLAYAALAALDGGANATQDHRVADVTARAIGKLWTDGNPYEEGARQDSLERSATELLGGDVVKEVNDAISKARDAALHPRETEKGGEISATVQAERDHFCAGAELEILRSAVTVDGCFEVGGALAPVRVMEEERVLVQVRHPTAHLVLVPARDAEDISDAIIGDPRTILLDLAAGRLLARRFVKEVPKQKSRIVMKSEVRVYVLDGSGSMKGPRARVRDALVVAELSTLIGRLQSPGATRCTFFYRYFDEELGPVTRVDGIASARAAVRNVVGTLREGGTDIQKAMLASLQQVREARELDPDLARAQIVLVTDGEAAVDEAAILEARSEIDAVPIGVSVIALGEENPALRALVAKQRAKGEPAFYHFVADDQLEAIASGALDTGLALHLPAALKRNASVVAKELQNEIGPLLDELAAIERERDVAAMEQLDAEVQARREAGLAENVDEGARARAEALARDRVALDARYARWFPEPTIRAGASSALPARDAPEREDVVAVTCALASVAEVVGLLGGSELARRADAIEMLERVLPDARVSPARYREVLREWPGVVAAPLRALHAAVRGDS